MQLKLLPLLPSLQADPTLRVLSALHFAVEVTEACSGLEGIGLMLAFCVAWLWYFRREYLFPRAFVIVPVAVLLICAVSPRGDSIDWRSVRYRGMRCC